MISGLFLYRESYEVYNLKPAELTTSHLGNTKMKSLARLYGG